VFKSDPKNVECSADLQPKISRLAQLCNSAETLRNLVTICGSQPTTAPYYWSAVTYSKLDSIEGHMRSSTKITPIAIAVGALFGIGAASAADLPARTYTKAPPMVAMYDWSGFYIGINGGGGSARKCWSETNDVTLGVQNPALPEGCHNATGGTAGGQIGYRWQSASWVFGLEAQGNWADFKGSNSNLSFAVTDNSKVDSFGLFTGQIGYAWNNVLLYAKGGAAVTHDKYFTNLAAGPIVDTASETRWGGVVGAGLEFGFAPNWSVAFEYDHMFMGTRDIAATGVGNVGIAVGAFSATDRITQNVDIGTVRLNYRFGGPIVAKY
jgi:outer membrane immunogenic protein